MAERGFCATSGYTLKGEAQRAGARLLPDVGAWDALVLSGETVVTGPYSGRGGRNLEPHRRLALEAKSPAQWALMSRVNRRRRRCSGAPGAYFNFVTSSIERARACACTARHGAMVCTARASPSGASRRQPYRRFGHPDSPWSFARDRRLITRLGEMSEWGWTVAAPFPRFGAVETDDG